MADKLNLKVSKSDFESRIAVIETKMNALQDVITRYNTAKSNLDQFIEGGDSNYEAMIERIDVNIKAAKKSKAALNEIRLSLQETVNQMEDMSNKAKQTIVDATQAAGSVINTALKIDDVL